MAIEHKNIPDAERHEPKGASTATAGQVARANGDGSTTFVGATELGAITIGGSPNIASFVTQGPSAVDTPYQVTFGAGGGTSDFNVASNGVITFTNNGLYEVDISLNVGRSNSTGTAILVARLLANDSPIDTTKGVRIDASTDSRLINFRLLLPFAAATSLKVQIMRDSGGANDGGLVPIDPVLAGWTTVPSALVKVTKIIGGF